MDSQVQSCITSCVVCQANDKTASTRPAPLQPVPLPDGPWKKLGLAIVGPFDTAVSACRYAITLTDYYSKWPELAFSHTATTEDVIHFLTSVFCRHGNPENIVTDNGHSLRQQLSPHSCTTEVSPIAEHQSTIQLQMEPSRDSIVPSEAASKPPFSSLNRGTRLL